MANKEGDENMSEKAANTNWEWADANLDDILQRAVRMALLEKAQFFTVAHVLFVMSTTKCFLDATGIYLDVMLREYIDANIERVPSEKYSGCILSDNMGQWFELAENFSERRKKKLTPGEFLLLLGTQKCALLENMAEEAGMELKELLHAVLKAEIESANNAEVGEELVEEEYDGQENADDIMDMEEFDDMDGELFGEGEEIDADELPMDDEVEGIDADELPMDGEEGEGDGNEENEGENNGEVVTDEKSVAALEDLMKKLKSGNAKLVSVTAKKGDPFLDSIFNMMSGMGSGGSQDGQHKGMSYRLAGFECCANTRPELMHAEEEEKKAEDRYDERHRSEGEVEEVAAEEVKDADEAYWEKERKVAIQALGKYVDDLASMHLRCLNIEEDVLNRTIVGRETELKRAIEVLCRKDKGNVIFIGEPGVGKTAMVSALVQRIAKGDVPQRMKAAIILEADFGGFVGDAQYRGEFEKRFRTMLNSVSRVHRCYLYIDEIHSIIGAGGGHGDSMDAATLLKPYLDSGKIRLIGCTTYDDYKQTFYRSKAFARRFTKVDVAEPSVDEAIKIMEGVRPHYEKYHRMSVGGDVMEYLVKNAAKHIADRRLPDKAIDLLDEVGAMCQSKRGESESYEVAREDVADVLSKMTGAKILSDDEDESKKLYDLEERIKAEVYGQDKAVSEVTEAVLMARAGLQDDSKPMASLLFVGPTGVGKTETARVLAKELGVPFVKFDMSEYSEKFTVSSLIGSPKGYVGYEEGGALTDAIRKSPYCVLLLDELEKAHADIYNILLQVMDYATLTDTKGEKADFRNVIIIMTTNAGAVDAKASGVGFVKKEGAGKAMMGAVKKTFKPEFINRLTGITVFEDMTREMADLVLGKCVRRLEEKLKAKGVSLELSAEARNMLLDKGYSREYGGRNVERVVNSELKPKLMKAILFGGLKNGGVAKADVENGELKVSVEAKNA